MEGCVDVELDVRLSVAILSRDDVTCQFIEGCFNFIEFRVGFSDERGNERDGTYEYNCADYYANKQFCFARALWSRRRAYSNGVVKELGHIGIRTISVSI